METQSIIVGSTSINLPDYYQKLQSMPDDRPGSVCYGTQTSGTQAFMLLFPIEQEELMPMDANAIINGIHHSLSDEQGLIVVDTIVGSNGTEAVYSIIKNAQEPAGVQYFLRLHLVHNGNAIELQGFFSEAGMTGQRDAVIFEVAQQKGAVEMTENGAKGWTRDPYDESYNQGFLMNLSEQSQFDEFFPEHPLSEARRLIKLLTNN